MPGFFALDMTRGGRVRPGFLAQDRPGGGSDTGFQQKITKTLQTQQNIREKNKAQQNIQTITKHNSFQCFRFDSGALARYIGKITKTISPEKQEDSTSREEIAALANIGANEGVFSEKENKMIQNILKLQKIKVTKIMTPRVVIVSINENTTLKE